MVGRRDALVVGLLLVGVAFAGCADDAPASERALDPGSTSAPGIEREFEPPPAPKPINQRWHFHDHWRGQPTIEIFNGTLNLTPTQGGDGLPALSALLELPAGTTIPPETGTVSVTGSWEGAGGALNLTFRPADSNDFHPAGDVTNGGLVNISVTESMADVPHRAQSLWSFNFTGKPGGVPPTLPPQTVNVLVTATIGRPLFIDPPHLDWWRAGEVLPLVLGAEGAIDTARTPAGNVTLPGLPGTGDPAPQPKPGAVTKPVTIPVEAGRIVPEGSKTLVVLVNWTSQLPGQKLTVRYREANLPSEGAMEVASDGDTNRVFVLAIDNDQTDTTYSNRTTWQFDVLPDAETGAFHGTFTLYAWVSKLDRDATLRETVGT